MTTGPVSQLLGASFNPADTILVLSGVLDHETPTDS
jgi:hypothetical protein